MIIDIDQPSISISNCQVSGMPIHDHRSLVSDRDQSDYKVNTFMIGDRIVHIKAEGYASLEDIKSGLNFVNDHYKDVAAIGCKLVGIENYTGISGASSKARQYYINYYRNCPYISLAIVYGLPPLMRASYKLAIRLNVFGFKLVVVDDYKQAIDLALKEIGQQDNELPEESFQLPRKSTFRTMAAAVKRLARTVFSGVRRRDPATEAPGRQPDYLTGEDLQSYRDELIEFIASINWDANGHFDYHHSIERNHPFRMVFDAISYIKGDLDTVLGQRDESEAALRKSERKYRQLVNHARAGIFQIDIRTGGFISTNKVMSEVGGYTREEFLTLTIFDILVEENRETVRDLLTQFAGEKTEPTGLEIRVIDKAGQKHWVLVNFQFSDNSSPKTLLTGVMTDITRIKETEEELLKNQERLRDLGSQLAVSEEKERRRIAGMLHDKVSQLLAGAKIRLSVLASSTKDQKLVGDISHIKDLVHEAIQESRLLTTDLSPPILYELGFIQAVEWLMDKYNSEYQLRIAFTRKCNEPDLSEEVQVILFRGLNELLHNVVKHANTEYVEICLDVIEEEVVLSVRDHGVGFSTEDYWNNYRTTTCLGLFNLKERLFYVRGRLELESCPGRGANITMAVPQRIIRARD